MPGGGGNATVYNRETGKFSGYGFSYEGRQVIRSILA